MNLLCLTPSGPTSPAREGRSSPWNRCQASDMDDRRDMEPSPRMLWMQHPPHTRGTAPYPGPRSEKSARFRKKSLDRGVLQEAQCGTIRETTPNWSVQCRIGSAFLISPLYGTGVKAYQTLKVPARRGPQAFQEFVRERHRRFPRRSSAGQRYRQAKLQKAP